MTRKHGGHGLYPRRVRRIDPPAHGRVTPRPFTHREIEPTVKKLGINKAGEDETASVLFQSNYSGRAEVGLVGNNDVGIKVSSDGQEFYELMRICGKTKRVGIGVSEPKAKLHVSGVLKLSPQPRDGLPDPSSVGAGCIVYVGPQENDTGYFAFSDGNSWTSMPIH